jgi:hypothetical protein
MVKVTARPFYYRERETLYPFNMRLGELHNRSGRFEEEKNLSPSNLETRIAQPVV